MFRTCSTGASQGTSLKIAWIALGVQGFDMKRIRCKEEKRVVLESNARTAFKMARSCHVKLFSNMKPYGEQPLSSTSWMHEPTAQPVLSAFSANKFVPCLSSPTLFLCLLLSSFPVILLIPIPCSIASSHCSSIYFPTCRQGS